MDKLGYPSRFRRLGELNQVDFEQFPLWIGVHNYDCGQPWHDQVPDDSFRPWTGELPFSSDEGTLLVASKFLLHDGTQFCGYCSRVPELWDELPPQRRTHDGRTIQRERWSVLNGGTKQAILKLLHPCIFVNDDKFSFSMRKLGQRELEIRTFYAAIGKMPIEVFPIEFRGVAGAAAGIVSGRLDGFYRFPLGGLPYEIDTGSSIIER